MTQLWRTEAGGRIDRTRPIPFVFDGTEYEGYAGDTVASALLANGVRRVSTSSDLGRPRGIVGSGVDEPCAVIQVEKPFPDPMRPATVLELAPGFAGRSISGRGRLADSPEPARYDAVFAHCDVLVVGAGPAGLAAAREAVANGARVIVCDEQSEFGGHALTLGVDVSGDVKELTASGAQLLPRTSVFGHYDDNFVVAVERRTDHLGLPPEQLAEVARERVWRIRAGRVVLATGAHERLIAFAGNDRPGVMLAGAAATYAARYGVRPGQRAVAFTTNDSTDLAVTALRESGVEVVDVVDARAGRVVVGTRGEEQLESVLISTDGGAPVEVAADLLAVSGGWNPAVQLWTQARGKTSWDSRIGAFVPDTTVRPDSQQVTCVGSLTGEGLPDAEALWMVPPADGDWSTHFVDLQRDVTVPDIRRALGTGMSSVEHVKRYTTAGTAHDQGRTSGTLTSGIVAAELGREIAELGTTSFRGPYASVSFAALAGRSGGDLLDPVRTTSIHSWHVEHGAVFEDVGQWKRPLAYPRLGETGPAEDLDDAVLRECRTVRERVGFLDASTLGKIDVQGPDAGVFLDLMYTNMISTLKVGSIRYGVLCHADGMVFDDGTVARIADDRFLVTTTTGNAAPVLAWFEEWLQTEWPDLRVFCTSVTEQWATVAIAGPRSRAVVGTLAPDLAVDNDSFGFMTWRDTLLPEVAGGLPARICRISFSGELAYEVNVSWDRGAELWAAVAAAGAAEGITPYGTETMHVLRAEKGYPIVGQDTDGTVIPHDLGLGWAVSKKKRDFLGKRSFARADATRPDRKHLVGLLPDDEVFLLREGTQIVAADTTLPLRPPVPMLGYVTSSYRSAALGRTFALALIAGGRERIGERLLAGVGDELIPVRVHSPVLVDPEGVRRDG
jgi:sarcosine oxidase subunit alpha